MSHPLDHAVILSSLRMTKTRMTEIEGGRSLKPMLNSGALAPLLISLDPRFRPRSVVLIHDKADRNMSLSIERLLSSLSIEVEHWVVDLTQLEALSHEIDQKLRSRPKALPLCVNSDEPLLSTLCTQLFLSHGAPILSCVDGSLLRLGAKSQQISLKPECELDWLISMLGARISGGWDGAWFEEHLKPLSEDLVQIAQTGAAPLTVIQRLAQSADREKLLSSIVRGGEIALPLFQEILDRFESAGCVELNQGRLLFSSEKHRAYCGGAWLTTYAREALSRALGRDALWAMRHDLILELAHPHSMQRELPLAMMVNSHLVFIFCVSSFRVDLDDLHQDSLLLKSHFSAHLFWLSYDELSQERVKSLSQDDITVYQGTDLGALEERFKAYFLT